MAAYTDTLGFNKGVAGFDAKNAASVVVRQEVVLDFAQIVAARAAASATPLAALDTLEVLRVPAGSVLLAAGLEVLQAETVNTTGTLDLTNGTTALPINALGLESNALAAPVTYTAEDTLDITIGTAAPTNAVVRAFAILADLG
jgi:hypothetical protein